MTRAAIRPEDVSIVMPTWKSAGFVTATLETVAAQTVRGFEVVVSDDGSPDNTLDVVEAFFRRHPDLNGRIVRNAHVGPGAARNAGLVAASRPWIAFLDSDDAWMPNKLARCLSTLASVPNANVLCHAEWHVLLDGRKLLLDYGARFDTSRPLAEQLYDRNLFSTSATMIRRDVALSSGGFDATLLSSQDYELWLRLSPQLTPVFVREPLGHYVDRPGNITSRKLLRRVMNNLRILLRHRRLVGSVRAAGIVLAKVGRKLRDGLGATPGTAPAEA